MKSFQFDSKVVRDTKIPSSHIPLVIIHWWHELYYGGDLTPLDMRKYLETKLRHGLYSQSAVTAWIRNAEAWKQAQEYRYPGRVESYQRAYHQLQVVA